MTTYLGTITESFVVVYLCITDRFLKLYETMYVVDLYLCRWHPCINLNFIFPKLYRDA